MHKKKTDMTTTQKNVCQQTRSIFQLEQKVFCGFELLDGGYSRNSVIPEMCPTH